MNIFTKEYWKAACGELKKLRTLALAALFCALSVVIGGLYIPVTNSLQIHFTFFVVAVGCAIYGPVTGVAVAAVADLLNYFLFQSAYPYFPGYMISEMLAALIYGLFLYRQKITVYKLFWSKVLVSFPINVALGALWSWMLYDKGYIADLWIRLVKNALLLPFEVIFLAFFFRLMIPVLSRMKLLPAYEKKELQRLQIGASVLPVLALSCLLGGVCSAYYAVTAVSGGWIFYILGILLFIGAIGLALAGVALNKQKTAEQ